MTKFEYEKLSRWIMTAVASLEYGEVTVELKIHDGQVKQLKRLTSESQKVDGGTATPHRLSSKCEIQEV